MLVLALDPGEKVGWARAEIAPDLTFTELQHGITGLKDMALACEKRISTYDLVVMEDWRLNAKTAKSLIGNDMQSSQFIGMIRLLGWTTNTKVKMQGPGVMNTARKTAPDWLQEIIAKEPKAHDDAHNVSALLHLWHWAWHEYVYQEAK